MKLFLHKLTHWEYWPFKVVYIPIYFLWTYYAIKARSFFFFNTVNPSIKNGGFFNESKKEIYDLIPPQYYPKTTLVSFKKTEQEIIELVSKLTLSFPFIAKPDVGLRGSAVKQIHSLDELLAYHSNAAFDYLIQDLIPYHHEIGIFYVRFPNEPKGTITGIVGKEFMTVTGDGSKTLEELILQNPRYALQLEVLQKDWKESINHVVPKGEKYELVPYGNHCRGTKFVDVSHKITPKLIETIDTMCQQIDGFYYGRMDLMFQSWQSLEEGNNFAIVELNGSASEPTHIYDPKHSIFFAWKEIARHISYMFKISQQNNKKGIPYLNYREGMAEYKKHQEHNLIITQF